LESVFLQFIATEFLLFILFTSFCWHPLIGDGSLYKGLVSSLNERLWCSDQRN